MTDDIKLILGKILTNQLTEHQSFRESEFKVFSQFGDDGLIQFLIRRIKGIDKFFIEFGVQDYLESNTRFLLENDNWSGLILDGSAQNIEAIKSHKFFWRYDLTAVQAFVTTENINKILLKNLSVKDVGILHIDIDGNDYWIWKAIDCISPVIVIVEYNSVFGSERAITIPYYSDFVRTAYHHSNLFAGASLPALYELGVEKGYYFIGTNAAGNNAYFVKREYIGDLIPITPQQGFVESKFRESRDVKGKLTYLRKEERLEAIRGMKVFNTRTNTIEIL